MRFHFGRPAAAAQVRSPGGPCGVVSFYPYGPDTLVVADICRLPCRTGPCASGIFALHIHEGNSCGGDNFADAKGHFNPGGCPHPFHAGDLPPLFSCRGHAFMAVLTDRFRIPEIIGRTVVIHSGRDDFTSQPAGDSGTRIACGVIRPV